MAKKAAAKVSSIALHGFEPYKEKKGEEYMNEKQREQPGIGHRDKEKATHIHRSNRTPAVALHEIQTLSSHVIVRRDSRRVFAVCALIT
mgnify:CR=1 FL=1